MIHIAIPTFQTFVEKYDSHKKYNVYDLNVNGVYHASVRYSTLYSLHEKLLETFGLRLDTAEFPPKKIWRNLDTDGAIKRKDGLVKYFKSVLQNQDIARHPLFERHFLDFQVSSFMPAVNGVKLEVFLPDGKAIHIDCRSDDSTDTVMRKVAIFLGLPAHYVNSFGLFLTEPRRNRFKVSNIAFDPICVRWLKNFESPFISQQLANRDLNDGTVHYELGLRRAIWDPSLEEPLLDDNAALKLLYLQAKHDICRGLVRVDSITRLQLLALEEQDLFRQFLHTCHQQVDYGYEYMPFINMDYPVPDSISSLKVGRHQLVIEFEENGQLCQHVIRSTRIRVWKVSQNDESKRMTFQVEYLTDRNNFKEITLRTDKAVLLALFLESIATEILMENNRRITPVFRFDDEMHTRVIEEVQSQRSHSMASHDIREDMNFSENMSIDVRNLFKVISHQMPFENETFEHLTNSDL